MSLRATLFTKSCADWACAAEVARTKEATSTYAAALIIARPHE